MSVTAQLTVGVSGPDDGLQLVYLKEDNLLPSEIEAAKESAANVAAGCNAVSTGPTKSAAEINAEKEALHHLDQHAWPIRKLRLYPPVNAVLRCSYGTIIGQHVAEAIEEEIITFSGSDQATLEHRGDPISITPVGRIFDETAGQVNMPTLNYRGRGLITADRRIWGQFAARYRTQYRVVQLTVVPTGQSFEVQAIAYHGGDVADTLVPFELLEFDTGQVAGVNCGGQVDASPEPTNPPPPAARYQLVDMSHAREVEKGQQLAVTMILRNINGVEGSGSVKFGLRYTNDESSAVFSCPANGQAQVNLSVTCTEVGNFITEGRVIGDFFSTRNGTVKVVDPNDEPEEWIEDSRVMSDIDVDGVAIKRIEEVTFNRGTSGEKVKLVFNNSGVE